MSVYRCPACSIADFSWVEHALDHVNSHSKSQKGCVVPGCRYAKQDRLSLHTRKIHRSSCQYPCHSCNRVFVRAANRTQHANDVHGGEAAFNLDSATNEADLNRFIDEQLQPNQSFNLEMKKTVKAVCSFFQEMMSPREILKGGSMRKGTAIKDKADIDLLLILPENEVNSASQLRENLADIKDEIEGYLRNEEGDRGFTVMPETIHTTTFSVQFTVVGGSEGIKVDLLPTFHFTDVDDLYEQMEDGPRSLLPFYSASLAKLQVDFVRPIAPKLKNLIRLVKYWRKENVHAGSPDSRLPNSYVLELITIHLWGNEGRPERFNTLKAFHKVMETLANNQSIHAIWEVNYDEDMIPEDILSESPLVMDPSNPFNNVCHGFSWDEIREEAEEALNSRMLRDVTSTDWD